MIHRILQLTTEQHGLELHGLESTHMRIFFSTAALHDLQSTMVEPVDVELQIWKNWGYRGMTISYTPLTPAMFKGQL